MYSPNGDQLGKSDRKIVPMRIRHKLLLTSLVPVVLLVLQVLSVNYFIRELQSAVKYIESAQQLLEVKFQTTESLSKLQERIKSLPLSYTEPTKSHADLGMAWLDVENQLKQMWVSPARRTLEEDLVNELNAAASVLSKEIHASQQLLTRSNVDFDSLVEQAIVANDALAVLDQSVEAAAIGLRIQLTQFVDYADRIHNHPTIAGVVIGSLAVLISMLLIWFYVDKNISRRLSTLGESTREVASGNLDAVLPEFNTRDEIGEMSEALHIFRDTAVEVADANVRERQQSKKQRQYWLENLASFLKHELKNKQVGAEQSINLLLKKDSDNSLAIRYGERAMTSLLSMRELINSAVHATDIESALLSDQFELLDISSTLEYYIQEIRYNTDADVVFVNELTEPVSIQGDRNRLEQGLEKLIYNAIDFHEPNTQIIIRTSTVGQLQVRITVENQGRPLPDNIKSLFELSVTSRDPVYRRHDNVGFGLFIARRIVEYHGGSITARNTDTGPQFEVLLPIEPNQSKITEA